MSEEIWKDIPGFEGLYQASTFGNVRSLNWRRQKIVKNFNLTRRSSGYIKVDLRVNKTKKTFDVHRLVAITFIDNPHRKSDVNHIDGNKSNNFVSNLEWATRSENMAHCRNVLHKQAGRKPRKVICVETGELFESIHSAVRTKRGSISAVWSALNDTNKTSGGFHWKYAD